MRRLVLTLAGVLLSVVRAMAFEEPIGFRDLRWEAEQAEVREKFPGVVCLPADLGGEHDDLVCRQQTKIGDTPVTVYLQLVGEPATRQFSSVRIRFPSDRYAANVGAFTDRYGPPASDRGDRCAWQGKTAQIAISRAGDEGRGTATISTQEYVQIAKDRAARQGSKAPEKAKKGL